MKVCYLIQTYKNPEQIYRLVKLIKSTTSNSFVIISHNFKSCSLNTSLFKRLKNVEVIPNNGVMMGSFAIIQGFFDAISWLLNHQIKFDWLINLTGQDYPTQPLSKIENFLSKTNYDGFVEYFDVYSKQSPWSKKVVNTRYLYSYKHFQDYLSYRQKYVLKPIKYIVNSCQPFVRLDYSYGLIIGVKNFYNLFDKNFTCYGGSFFVTISDKCAIYLNNFIREQPQILSYYKKTFIPEESLIQTILVNSRKFNLCNRNYRYADFSGSRHGHPRILTSKDFHALSNDNIHFARKFDPKIDSEILNKLDRRILTNKDIHVNIKFNEIMPATKYIKV
ncbi:putative N-acetylglucosaminyltransferase [Rivularia sp. PCC 7116]|uniref:beta-1,6-N-acetylglucosaminyltransferase n=1 Tax=Rivularia sp. PCC 7116 TaxID=373994 RepID=UPI00029F0D28|nr:beta-1,6-N-acetylglucosaminyltransferase [Rivularia sp. PCC 7116]AFY58141.1 putative N-acetylglucosaminyltransferase [Rivularia sp. PCC 7116]